MRVNHVRAPLAANPDALKKSVNDIGDSKQLQPRLGGHFAWSAFFVREDFPGGGRIAEAVHMRAIDVVALESFVRRGEYLDFNACLFEVRDGSAQPGNFGVFLKSRINGAYDKDFHCSCFAACCAWISWMQLG